jgi:hypothetical protein
MTYLPVVSNSSPLIAREFPKDKMQRIRELAEYVVLRAEVYDQIKGLIYDDGPLTD